MLSPTSAWCPVSAVQPSVQAPQPLTPQRHRKNAENTPGSLAKKWGGKKIPVRGCRIFLTHLSAKKMGGLSPSPNQAGGWGHYSSVPIPLSYRALLPFIMNQSSENIVTRSTLPHSGLCGPLSRTAPACLRAVKIVVRTVPCAALGQETPLPVLRRAIS